MIAGPRSTLKLARKLRSEMSLPEVLIWRQLRLRPNGLKFRRQHPAGAYILDFYCAAARLAIEVDGVSHDGFQAERRHAARSHFLRSQGIATLRVPASAVLEDTSLAVARIVKICCRRVPLHHAAHGPPPPQGED